MVRKQAKTTKDPPVRPVWTISEDSDEDDTGLEVFGFQLLLVGPGKSAQASRWTADRNKKPYDLPAIKEIVKHPTQQEEKLKVKSCSRYCCEVKMLQQSCTGSYGKPVIFSHRESKIKITK